jgi:hypothetical protein
MNTENSEPIYYVLSRIAAVYIMPALAVFTAMFLIPSVITHFRDHYILNHGIESDAVVLSSQQLGAETLGLNVTLDLVLKVQPPGHKPFEVNTVSTMCQSLEGAYKVGQTVSVRYDPHDHFTVLNP